MQAKAAYLRSLAQAVQDIYNLPALHVQTAHVSIDFGLDLWRGDVEVFAVISESQARRCFAWIAANGTTVVLESSLGVKSPEDAVLCFHNRPGSTESVHTISFTPDRESFAPRSSAVAHAPWMPLGLRQTPFPPSPAETRGILKKSPLC